MRLIPFSVSLKASSMVIPTSFDSAPGQEVQMSGVGDHPIQIEYNGIKVHLSPPW